MPSAILRTDFSPEAVYSALGPEIRRDLPRTRTSIGMEDGAVVIRVEAADTSALRASVNSVLECLSVTQRIDTITKAKT